MSGRTKKIGIKNQLREALLQLRGVQLYFNEYDLSKHFQAWIIAKNEGKELPKKLMIDELQDEITVKDVEEKTEKND